MYKHEILYKENLLSVVKTYRGNSCIIFIAESIEILKESCRN